MNRFLSLVAVALVSVSSLAVASPMLLLEEFAVPDGIAYAFSLDVDDQNGLFNTFRVEITPDAGEFRGYNPTGAIRTGTGYSALVAGADASFTNALLPTPPVIDDVITIVDGFDDTASDISYSVTRPGVNFNFTAPVFLNNVVLPTGKTGVAKAMLYNGAGEIFQTLTTPFGTVPEPTSLLLAGFGMLGFVAKRRRS